MTSTATAVAEREERSEVVTHPASQSVALMQMAERLATNPDADVSKLKQILDIAREAKAEEAAQSYSVALGEAQRSMTRIAADAENPQTRSKYASYAALDRALRPLYTEHGFAISYDTGPQRQSDTIHIIAYVSHRDGFTRDYHADIPNDGKGAKGNDVMTKTHATGAAMSYGMRYLLKMIFNVAVGTDDKDGNTSGAVISDEQLKKLQALASEVGGDIAKLCTHFKIDALPDLPVGKYAEAVGIMELRRQKGAAK